MCIGVHKRGKVKNEQPKRLWKILTVKWIKVKGNGHPRTGHEGTEGEQRYSSTLTLTSTLDGGGWSAPRPGRFTPRKDPVPIVQEAVWASGPVWTGAENLAPLPGFYPQIVRPVSSRYTDWAIAAHRQNEWLITIINWNNKYWNKRYLNTL